MGVRRVGDDPGDDRQVHGPGHALAGHDQGGGAVRDRTGIGGGDGAVLGEGRTQGRDLLGAGLARLLVGGDRLGALARGHLDRRDLGLEGALFDGGIGTAQGFDRVFVLLFTGELVLAGGVFGEGAHQLAGGVGVLETVHVHGVDDHIVADAGAAAVLVHDVGGAGHRLHATRDDDVSSAGHQGIVGHHGRLQA